MKLYKGEITAEIVPNFYRNYVYFYIESILFEWEPVEWIFIFHVLFDRIKGFFLC